MTTTETNTHASKPADTVKPATKPAETKPAQAVTTTSPAPTEKTRAPRGSLPAPTLRETARKVQRLLDKHDKAGREQILAYLGAAEELGA